MATLTAPDGTRIAYDRQGSGPALILVDGATQTRASGSKPELAGLLAEHFEVYCYDRRGRGESGDSPPYAVEREIEDLGAVMDLAGGSASVYAHSSGACLALLAAAELGDRVRGLALYEPPYHTDPDGQRRWGTYIAQLTDALASGRPDDAMALFFAYVSVPAEQIEAMRQAPFWAELEAIAPTLAYDHTAILGPRAAVPVDVARRVAVPTVVACGDRSPALLTDAATAVAGALPHARLVRLRDQDHNVEPAAIAPVLVDAFASAPAPVLDRRQGG